MESSYFPEDKDLAHKIMMELSNSDLIKVCATNKRMYEICNNYSAFGGTNSSKIMENMLHNTNPKIEVGKRTICEYLLTCKNLRMIHPIL